MSAQLHQIRALPGDLAPRDAQDLMAYPLFSLAKTPRTTPIDFQMNDITISVEAGPGHGMATIWDADALIWAASQNRRGARRRPAYVATDRGATLPNPDLHRPRHGRA
jgi:plasmid replication initiation protein